MPEPNTAKQLRLDLGIPEPAPPILPPARPAPPRRAASALLRPAGPAAPAGLDYTAAMAALIRDVCARCPEFAHVRPDRLLVSFSVARVTGEYGQLAKIVPLRFEGGSETLTRGKQTWTMPRLTFEQRDILYLIYFCMPKYQNLKFRDKLQTVFHEMYHVSPAFDGDIRRFPGRKYAHGHSRSAYDALVSEVMAPYLASVGEAHPPLAFLHPDFRTLEQQHGKIVGMRVRMPRPRLRR